MSYEHNQDSIAMNVDNPIENHFPIGKTPKKTVFEYQRTTVEIMLLGTMINLACGEQGGVDHGGIIICMAASHNVCCP